MLEDHLGGHLNKTHLDEGALLWLKSKFNAKTYLDIGCGPGGMVELAESHNLTATGVDGDYTLDRYNPNNFILHDFTTGPAPLIAMTYAPPGWTGHHHVNLQEEQYWIDKLAEYNLIYNAEYTQQLREQSTMNQHKKKKAFVKNRGMIFINEH